MNLLLTKSVRGLSFCLVRMLIIFAHGGRMGIPGEVARGDIEDEGPLKQLDGRFKCAGLCLGLYEIVQASEMVWLP